MTNLKIGDVVRLKTGTYVGDRKGALTAVIQGFLDPEIPSGVFLVRPGLRSCRYWNTEDLIKVKLGG